MSDNVLVYEYRGGDYYLSSLDRVKDGGYELSAWYGPLREGRRPYPSHRGKISSHKIRRAPRCAGRPLRDR